MENLDKLDKLLGQFPGSRAVFYAEKLGWSRSKVYDNLNSLQIRQLAYNKNGLWYPSTEQKPDGEKIKNEYLELDPENAEIVARIDWILEHFVDQDNPKEQALVPLFKLIRDYHVKIGTALGR